MSPSTGDLISAIIPLICKVRERIITECSLSVGTVISATDLVITWSSFLLIVTCPEDMSWGIWHIDFQYLVGRNLGRCGASPNGHMAEWSVSERGRGQRCSNTVQNKLTYSLFFFFFPGVFPSCAQRFSRLCVWRLL